MQISDEYNVSGPRAIDLGCLCGRKYLALIPRAILTFKVEIYIRKPNLLAVTNDIAGRLSPISGSSIQ